TALPHNINPATLSNRVSQNLLTWKDHALFPQGGFLPYPSNDALASAIHSPINLFGTDDLNIDSDQYLGRVDHRLTEKDRLFGRYVIVSAAANSIPLV